MQNNTPKDPEAADKTDCNSQPLLFQDLGSRKVVADFSGGQLSNDGGALLLRQVDNSIGLTSKIACCFSDARSQSYVEHSLPELIAQRIFALALGYEDINDHQDLRRDPVFAAAAGKIDPLGENRRLPEDRGNPLAAPCTLNRLELSNDQSTRAHKFTFDADQIEGTLLTLGVRCLDKHAREIILDFDATDDPLHGDQEGAFFNAYYDCYCYMPLYCFIGDIPVWSQLCTSDEDASEGTLDALKKIVQAVRKRCPRARIILRGDSGFCRDEIMNWCEANRVRYVLGLARNSRLVGEIQEALSDARARQILCGTSVRIFRDFQYRTHKSWSCERRVVGKAEVTMKGDNPRFIVTNIPARDHAAADLYEGLYCGRGRMENVIKQQQLDLHADRTSTRSMEANQLRLWFTTLAYLLIERIRAWGLGGTKLARAYAGTIIRKILKIPAQVSVSVRRVYVQISTSYPLQSIWRECQRRLQAHSPPGGVG